MEMEIPTVTEMEMGTEIIIIETGIIIIIITTGMAVMEMAEEGTTTTETEEMEMATTTGIVFVIPIRARCLATVATLGGNVSRMRITPIGITDRQGITGIMAVIMGEIEMRAIILSETIKECGITLTATLKSQACMNGEVATTMAQAIITTMAMSRTW